MMKILIATTNNGKKKEILSALLPLPGVEFAGLLDLGINTPVEEHGTTYQENALLKARGYFQTSGLPTIAEDSGMEVSALEGELGVHTRHWGAGAHASDEEWLAYFMNRMKDEKNRAAKFVCHAVYIDGTEEQHFQGECLGTITEVIEGPVFPGIPLSAVFKPVGESLVYSSMSEEQKNRLSHRGKAIKKLRHFIFQSKQP